jgi:hypothetical protein
MADGPHYRRAAFRFSPGSQFVTLPRGAFLTFAHVVGRELCAVYYCHASQPDTSRTFRVEYLKAEERESREFSPAWQHVVTASDNVGGYVSLLELTA